MLQTDRHNPSKIGGEDKMLTDKKRVPTVVEKRDATNAGTQQTSLIKKRHVTDREVQLTTLKKTSRHGQRDPTDLLDI